VCVCVCVCVCVSNWIVFLFLTADRLRNKGHFTIIMKFTNDTKKIFLYHVLWSEGVKFRYFSDCMDRKETDE
jgi:hypothetical protein